MSDDVSFNLIQLSNGKIFERKKFSKYSSDELKEIIFCCSSISDIITTLKINKFYHKIIKKFIENNNIPTDHFTSKKTSNSIQDKLTVDSCLGNSTNIKKYLLNNNIVKNECAICNIPPSWNNKPLTLQLDHINGDHYDNRIHNLRLLCPNCHTQTDTYTGRNLIIYNVKKCSDCNKILKSDNSTLKCADCISKLKHLCSVCQKNNKYGNYSRCKECLNKDIPQKVCKGCGKKILRYSNLTLYHKKCYKLESSI
jgi:Zn finger protein HypA/HybF involved in hydrogenase expression